MICLQKEREKGIQQVTVCCLSNQERNILAISSYKSAIN